MDTLRLAASDAEMNAAIAQIRVEHGRVYPKDWATTVCYRFAAECRDKWIAATLITQDEMDALAATTSISEWDEVELAICASHGDPTKPHPGGKLKHPADFNVVAVGHPVTGFKATTQSRYT